MKASGGWGDITNEFYDLENPRMILLGGILDHI
jgi:hypothetical protein